ncbi:MAG: aldehyde ferredoxin oxidoreductase family protein [Anaerolineae bacterium]|nr:aldehyde ferredoxin oxidoreductase family protein [Anaerolineae bacterium]
MPYGYHGKILHVDLTARRIEVETPPEAFYRKYMGGSALGMYYLLKDVPQDADPLGPENCLIFSLSVITGAPVHGLSRATATAKSPLTGGAGDGQAGGFWPAEAKFAGFDAFVIKGRSETPVYLWVHDGQAELKDATQLWGKDTAEAMQLIREEVGDDKVEVAGIGRAGENMVRVAAIMNMANRAHGRTGLGAVMGSKNLKAIAVRGKDRPKLANRPRVLEIARWGRDEVKRHFDADIGKYGTIGIVSSQHFAGGLPTYNWNSGSFALHQNIDGHTLYDTYLEERDTCYSCATKCKRTIELESKRYGNADPVYGGPEYENAATLGSYCGVGAMEPMMKANELCNRYGLDAIGAGATIAWAMETNEHGLLPPEIVGDLDLRFGNGDALVKALTLMATREGPLGDLLAEGSAHAARRLGNGSEAFLITVKNAEAPAHMPQVKRSLALIYAVNPFGADHMSASHDPGYTPESYPGNAGRLEPLGLTKPQDVLALNPEKVEWTWTTQKFYSLMDSLDVCHFDWGPTWELYGPTQLLEVVQAITGWDVTLDELLEVGERRINMMREFNAREGLGRADDKLPKRLHKMLEDGASKGLQVTLEEVEAAKDVYYTLAGWDVATGVPQAATLERLGLGWVRN